MQGFSNEDLRQTPMRPPHWLQLIRAPLMKVLQPRATSCEPSSWSGTGVAAARELMTAMARKRKSCMLMIVLRWDVVMIVIGFVILFC